MNFALGQRWVSHADADLGLGIIVELEARRITLHFPAVAEDRTYATNNAPLTRLQLAPGDTLRHSDGGQYEVIDRQAMDDVFTYRVQGEDGSTHEFHELEIDPHVQLRSPKDRLFNNQLDKLTDFELRLATLEQRAHAARSAVGGLLGARTALLSHQMYIASEVGNRFAPRVMLADEVGLGKTIEAGLILAQQLATGRASRVLVIVPETLIHQWLVEMLRRFNLHFSLMDEERLAATEDGSAFESEQLIITPSSMLAVSPEARDAVLAAGWDLLIVDEAHHLSSDQPEGEVLVDFMRALATTTSGLLLLTATPEQAGIKGHFERLQLLDPHRFPDLETFQAEQHQFKQWSDTIALLQAGQPAPNLPAGVDPTSSAADQISSLLDRYGTGRILFRNTRASVPGFPVRSLQATALPVPQIYQSQVGEPFPERHHPEADWIAEDPRVDWLTQTLGKLRPAKVLVITAHAETALALEHHLHLRAGVRCAAFHEGLSLLERDRAAAYFAEETGGAQALICSEIGSEGRNFQFAHHLVCFDLPRNPDLLEQRIGRLDRIGQSQDVIVHVPFLEHTAQHVLFRWHNESLAAFTNSCAVGQAVTEQFSHQLDAALASPQSDIEQLISGGSALRESLEQQMREGRDRLLELNSHNPSRGAEIIEAIETEETPEQVLAFSEQLFDRIGVAQDYHTDSTFLLKPTEMLVTGQLPGLDEDGTVVSFDRQTALARDDVLFLTREHPLLREAMDVVLSSELGNSALGTLKNKSIPAGTVLLECVFSIECLAPAQLQMSRYIATHPLRFVMDPQGKDRSSTIRHEILNRVLETVPVTTAANVIRRIRPLLEQQLSAAEQLAQQALRDIRTAAEIRINESLGAELDRLNYLQGVNPAVRDEELTEMRSHIENCIAAVTDTRAVSQALRVIVAT
ncbi:MAG: RNA polymerase-associated protein RapA [Cellvibrionales bacterium]|jgi:ATP-dependent helicase HepA